MAVHRMVIGHYEGVHDPQFCGQLRTDIGVCQPFALFRDCDPVVKQIIWGALSQVIAFVLTDGVLVGIDVRVNDQRALRQQFGIPAPPGHTNDVVDNNEDDEF